MPWPAWKAVLLRSWKEASDDNIGLVGAGVAFYGFLALVPLMGAIVLSYGLVAAPETVVRNMRALTSVMPADAAKLVGEQLMNVVKTSGTKKGFGLLLALGIALFGARNGAGSIMTALNIAYEEKERRGFLMVNVTALAITAGGVLVAIVAIIAIAALGHLENLLPGAPGVVLVLGKLISYALLFLAGAAGAATLYRYAPSRAEPRWVWLTPGSLLSSTLWLLLTLGFGIYVANFGNYNATYGSLGAVVVLLTWLYLSSYILLFGAELNSEFEHQTSQDSTTGAALPPGQRGAWAADHVAGADGSASDIQSGDPGTPPADASAVDHAPSASKEWVAARATSRVAAAAGLERVGLIASTTATLGLSMLRRRDKALQGAALLGSAAFMAWMGGRAEDAERESATRRQRTEPERGSHGPAPVSPVQPL